MTQQILSIHGGNIFKTHEEYLNYLRNKKITLEDLRFVSWKERLGSVLGKDFEVFNPLMPNAKNARYIEWRIMFEKFLPLLDDGVILIGHSLGGTFLAKYLSENDTSVEIKATLLVAPAYDIVEGGNIIGDFTLPDSLDKLGSQGGKIFIYQSKDDPVVPFENVEKFCKALPDATARIFENCGHFHQEEFPEIAVDLKSLY